MAHTKVTKTHSQNTGVANTYSYSGSFDVFKATEVVVTLDAVALTYTASTINESASPREYTVDVSAKTVHIGGADLSSGSIVIRPKTDMGAPTPRATYTPGASITSEDLNNNQKQLMRKAMEYDETKLDSTGGSMTGDLTLAEDTKIIFEGATDDAYETTLTVTDPTADRTITIPNVTGTVVTTGDTATVTATMMAADSVDSSELVDGSIDSSHISSSAVTTGKISADAVTGAKIADDAIDSEHYTDGSIDTAHIAAAQVTTAKLADNAITTVKITDANVTTAKIAGDAITGAKIADDSINSEHYVDASIDTAHIADAQITTAKIAADAVTNAKIADDQIDSEHYVDGSIDTAHIGDNQVTTAKIADSNITTAKLATDAVTTAKITDANVTTAKIAADAITGAKIADDAIDSEHYTDGSIDTAHIADSQVTTAKIAADAITAAKVADDIINSEHYAAASIDTEHIADGQVTAVKVASNAVTTAKITDANVTTVKIADSNVTLAKLASDLKQTSISDSDTQLPTSGAVVDYVAAQIAPIGGLEVIATDAAFPNTQPAAGVVISIADAGGLVVNGSGTSTTGRTVGASTVTINNIASNFNSSTVDAGVAMMVSSTGSGHIYNYHKATLKEADLLSLSNDINDFAARYRVNAGEPGSNNDEGDLVYDTNADKMKVYDSSTSAWKEVTSTGDFKFLVPVDAGTTTAASWDGSDTSFDLKEATNSGSAASVTNVNQLTVVLNGVVQKPNAGSWSGSGEGFYLTDADTIRFATAPPSNSTCFIIQAGSAVSIPTPGDGTVSAAKIASGAVTTAKLADANVTTAKLASDSVTGAKIAANSVDSSELVDGSIDASHIASNAVLGSKIAADAVTAAKIADANVTTAKIADSNVTTAKINADAVTGAKIADDAIDSEHYTDGSIDTAHIADSQVTTAKIAADAITAAKIADDVINSEHIAAGAVDLEHMASESVDEDNLKISNAGSNGQFLQKQTGNTGGLTWASAAGDLNTLTDCTVSSSNPTTTTNPGATGHYWINKSTGDCYVCTQATNNDNIWTNVGVGTTNIESESPIQQHDNCWWYTRFDKASSIDGTNIVNMASGSSKYTGGSVPVAGGVRGSGSGSYTCTWSSDTQAARLDFSNADPWSPSTHGMTMGALFKKSDAAGGRGVIYYGDTGTDNHFFWRTDFANANTLSVGEDTGSTDTWTDVATSINDSTWYFLVVKISTDGTLSCSKNGAAFSQARSQGSAPTPTNALFGIQGDPYNDNAGSHEFAAFFTYKGLMTDQQVSDEWDYLDDIWTLS